MMKNKLTIFLFFISFTVISQIKNTEKFNDLISSSFINSDSLKIRIHYMDRLGCTEIFPGRIKISVMKEKFSFSNVSLNDNRISCHYGGMDNGIINCLLTLESKGKSISMCTGIDGDATSIKMSINDKETEFEFCSNNWDGIKELVERLSEMRTSKFYTN